MRQQAKANRSIPARGSTTRTFVNSDRIERKKCDENKGCHLAAAIRKRHMEHNPVWQSVHVERVQIAYSPLGENAVTASTT